MMVFNKYFILAFALLLCINANAQRTTVKGTVSDDTGGSIPGASVVVQGTTRGVITDLDGSYSIEVGTNDKLVISFIGYDEQIVTVGTQTVIDITLYEKRSELEEVTIVGFGSQRKASVIGAISSVSVSELRMPVGKVSTSLAGRLAGVVSLQRSGEPGAGADFWIRGVNTFGINNKPLVLVDGVERDLDLVDTEDIEAFSILKDATATAIFGVRGANGVVLITTRRGKEGKPVVSARVERGILAPTKMPEMANAADFIKMYNDVYREVNGVDFYTPELAAKYINREDPDLYPNVDWIKTIYKDYTFSNRVNLNITGGNQTLKYYVAGSYYTEDGIFNADTKDFNPEMRWTKYSFRSNIDINLTKSTLITLNLSTQYDVKNRPNSKSGDVDYLWIYTYLTIPVAIPPIYSDGTVSRPMSAGTNPYNTLNKTGYVQEFNNNSQSLVGITQDFSEIITKGLKANVKFSWDVVNNSTTLRSLSPSTYYATGRDEDGNLIFHKNNDGTDYLGFGISAEGTRILYLESSLTYERLFNNAHRVGGLFLFNMNERTYNIPWDYISAIPRRNNGIAGRATYSYKDKYFIEGNFGYNGSENFAPGHMLGFFPSVALGYIISEEDFFKPIKNTVSLLKLKGSYGKIGNDKIGNERDQGQRFAFNSQMNPSAAGYTFGSSGGTSLTGIATGYPGNPEVSWEQSVKANAGFEIELYNKLKLQTDFFYDDRRNIFILRRSVPSVVGVNSNPYMNVGRMENKGIDMTLEYAQQFNKDLFVSVRGTMTYNRNRKLYDDEPLKVVEYQNEIGRPLYQQFGLVSLGYFESWEDIDNSPKQSFGDVRPGDVKYLDVNGDGVINELDKVAIGRTHVPELNYGFGTSSMYKRFDVSFFFSGVGLVTGFLDGSPINGFEQNAVMAGVFADVARNRWTEENPNPNAKYPRMAINVSENNKQLGTHKQRDMSFLRLKNAELGYTLPKHLAQKMRISTFRVYLQGYNLFTITPFNLWDPEINNSQGAVYPNMRTLNLGININF